MLVGYADAAFVVKMSQSTCYKARRMNGLISSIIPPTPGSVAVPATIAAPVSATLVNIGTLQPQKAGQIVTSSYDQHCADQETLALANNNVITSPTTADDCLEDPIDLRIRNVVTMFNVCCHLDLHHIAMHTSNVIYERYRGVLILQIKKPRCYVKMWSSGKITVSGAQSEEEARKSSRSVARIVQKIVGPRVRFADYRVTNIMATCKLPFGIRIPNLATEYPRESSYEPELSIGLVWRCASPKATLRIHSTGSITITGAESQADILTVMESLYPILVRFKCSTFGKTISMTMFTTTATRMLIFDNSHRLLSRICFYLLGYPLSVKPFSKEGSFVHVALIIYIYAHCAISNIIDGNYHAKYFYFYI
ncbi:TATA box-binding protein-like protein 1 [Trichinella zimbabwensis]|uniref:TATA box-binding protein-like 1 n=1 Tax=Trichinella zimbabwensis TaxID=268475 RepID=A0A0V1HES7_9BILA|nr:TATA box-binding protein-like protein 1 [Trichinella zimbabwensis]